MGKVLEVEPYMEPESETWTLPSVFLAVISQDLVMSFIFMPAYVNMCANLPMSWIKVAWNLGQIS